MNRQEQLNEKSYRELLLGKKKDPTKDPRWRAVNGLTITDMIISGRMQKGTLEQHIRDFCKWKKQNLIGQIHGDKR